MAPMPIMGRENNRDAEEGRVGQNMDFNHELVIPNEDLPFKLFLFEGKDGNYRRAKHWHRSVEIFLVLEGELEFFLNNSRLRLKAEGREHSPGPPSAECFVIVNSNEIHSIEAPEPNTTIVVQIPIHYFAGYLREDDYAVFAKQSEAGNQKLIRLIVRMFEEYRQKKFAYELKVHSMFLELLYLLVTEFMKTEENQNSIRQKRRLDKLSRITAYMKKHYDEDITLESVAAEFGFSPTYLSRMFQKYANVGYKTYLLDLRTEYGLREMMNTDHSLNEVALNNGFPNSRAYAKAFRKRYGCLPGEYRRRMSGNEARKCCDQGK